MKNADKQKNQQSQPAFRAPLGEQRKVDHDDDCPFSTEEQEMRLLTEPQATAVLKVTVFALSNDIARSRSEIPASALHDEIRLLLLACNDGRLPQSIEDQQRLKQSAERLRRLFLQRRPDDKDSHVM